MINNTTDQKRYNYIFIFLNIFYIIISLSRRNNISIRKIIYKNIINIILAKILSFIFKKNRRKKKNCGDNNARLKLTGGVWGRGRGNLEAIGAINNKKN